MNRMKQFGILIAVVLTAVSCGRRITVYNDSDIPIEGGMTEVDLFDIFPGGERDFVLLDKDGNVVSSQITYEEMVIFPVDVPPMGKSVYRVEKLAENVEDNANAFESPKVVEPIVAVTINGEPVFPAGIDRNEILDNGPLRHTVSALYFPIPIDTTWVKPRTLTSVDFQSGLLKKVWFEDLKGEHEIIVAIPDDRSGTDSVSEDSLSFSHGNTTVFLSTPVHNIGYREVSGKVCLAGYCTLDGPEPLELRVGKSVVNPLDYEICGIGR